MAYSYESLKIGPLIIPELTSCIESLSKLAVDNYGEHYKIEKFERLYNEFLFHPSISFNINILSSIIFKEILFFLIEEFEYCMSIGRMLIFNPLNLSVKPHLIKCDENCKICYYKDKKL